MESLFGYWKALFGSHSENSGAKQARASGARFSQNEFEDAIRRVIRNYLGNIQIRREIGKLPNEGWIHGEISLLAGILIFLIPSSSYTTLVVVSEAVLGRRDVPKRVLINYHLVERYMTSHHNGCILKSPEQYHSHLRMGLKRSITARTEEKALQSILASAKRREGVKLFARRTFGDTILFLRP